MFCRGTAPVNPHLTFISASVTLSAQYLTMSTTTASTIANNARFNAEAVKWDSNVAHVRCCEMALESVLHHVPAFADGQAKSRIVQIRFKL